MTDPLSLELAARLWNIAVCIGCSAMLAKLYLTKETRFRHNLYWSLAFAAWALQLIWRIPEGFAHPYTLASGIAMGLLFTLGATSIIGHTDILLSISTITVAIVVGDYFYFGASSLWYLPAFTFMFIMLASAAVMRRRFGAIANWFLIGWNLIIISNALSPAGGTPIIADISAGAAKLIFLQGMMKPRYAYIMFLKTKPRLKPLIKTIKEKSPVEELIEQVTSTTLLKAYGEQLEEISTQEIKRITPSLFEAILNIKTTDLKQTISIKLDLKTGELSIPQTTWETMPHKQETDEISGVKIRITTH
ncbi:MAG: hypothetical protein HYU39_04565 [Thaumarchaeota archaeon]|nr:hypothetical protein [Nitrososphaerota archaeon]